MDGDNIYKSNCQNGIIVMGNEANGISKEIEAVTNDCPYRVLDSSKTRKS
jgi:TrmH family RNA methyltransferase